MSASVSRRAASSPSPSSSAITQRAAVIAAPASSRYKSVIAWLYSAPARTRAGDLTRSSPAISGIPQPDWR